MRISNFLPLVLLGLLGSSAPQPNVLPASSVQPSTRIVGDYVEARTASVFAGACHYNGELVTTGSDAILAWKITAGDWQGTELSGLTAMVAVSSEANLHDETANRRSEIIVNASATPAQADALAGMIEKQCGRELGKVVSIRRGTVLFDHTGSTYSVKSASFAEMTVQALPNDECCKQPSLVWYSPLVQLDHRKVGYTVSSSYSAGVVGDPWQRSDENTAFYGAFHF
jgi:hypothetical protein